MSCHCFLHVFQLTVALEDQAGRNNINTATLTINVIRNQFTPFFINDPYQVAITEGVGLSPSIYQVTARDNDPTNTFEQVRYQVTGDGNAPAFFDVNAVTGVISVTQSLAGNSDIVYNLRVTAYDNGIPRRSNSTIVVITIDRNRNAPVFSPRQYTAQVADNGILGSQIVAINVDDADTVSPYNVTKCFLRQTANSQYFFIDDDTCVLYLARNIALDANAPSTYTLNVGAYDLGIPSKSAALDATVTISVQRNQFSPQFLNTPYRRTIDQTLAAGSFILRASANDADTVTPFGDVTIRLIGDENGPTYFSFDATSGNITVARSLTTDTASFYQLRLQARDGGNPARSTTTLVEISVNRNLFNPEFTQTSYETTIDEIQALGETVVQMTGRDVDDRQPHNVLFYSMSTNTQNSLASQYFQINSATGAISLRQSLLNDVSDTRRYAFTVSLRDNGIPQRQAVNTASVVINVLRNTNPPTFINTPYDRNIDYTATIGTSIFTATATDADESPYNVISYELVGDGDATVFFRIDPSTGVVSLRQRISEETTTIYRVIS